MRTQPNQVRSQTCNVTGKTCPLLDIPMSVSMPYLQIVEEQLPGGFTPDFGSSIPQMGMHTYNQESLGRQGGTRVPYSRESVHENPPLFVGTYDSTSQFVEASPVVPMVNQMLVDGRR